ncbi:CHAT domain-containing protein [Archangium minus]|uniref:CHAT domain-containing protein n=1 Tax=Archangium minus TaxID=83450 RepID=A0ABY9WNW4_9BACT|nr:CHAT domain-containing protein [Archangium minus]
MHVVDVESMEADRLIDLLLNGGALHELVGEHGAACFALPGPLHAQAFYEALIEHSADIDATTRQHVAFILFYGKASTRVRDRRYGYTLMRGLSTSTNSTEMPPRGWRTPEEVFPESLGDHFRYRPQDIDRVQFRQEMTSCTRALLDRFTLPHSVEPCVLFVNPVFPERHFTVALDKRDPVRSLFEDLLNPLSDAFRLLSSRVLREHEEASRLVEQRAKLVSEIRQLELRVAHVEDDARSATWTALREAFRGDWKNADHVLSVTGIEGLVSGDEVRALKESRQRCAELTHKLEALSAEDGSDALDEERRSLRSAIAKSANWRVNKLAVLRAKLQRRPEFDEGCRRAVHAHLARARGELPKKEEDARRAEERLVKLEASRLEMQEPVDIQRSKLQRLGLRPDMLQVDGPQAFYVVKAMQSAGSIGAKARIEQGGHMVSVLVLAANPHVYERPLDLERELRDLKEVLHGVRYRDAVTVEVGHAVRVDDLVHLLREHKPDIVHFCGHGSPNGVQLRAEDGRDATEVSGDSLARVFQDRGVTLLVLNACFSGHQASVLSKVVQCVVGTTDAVGDDDSRRFSKTFFKTLGNGHTVEEAFRDGRDVVDASGGIDVFRSFGNLDRVLFGPSVARSG